MKALIRPAGRGLPTPDFRNINSLSLEYRSEISRGPRKNYLPLTLCSKRQMLIYFIIFE